MTTEYRQFLALSQARYSCRLYSDEPVSDEHLRLIAEAARLAPSACNRQPWHLLIVTDAERRQALTSCYGRDWLQAAPAFIAIIGNHAEAWHREAYDGKDHTDVDAAIITEHICLAAASLGIGSCWICNFDAARFSELFGLSPDLEPIAIVALGHPAKEGAPEKIRKPLSEIASWQKL